MKLLASALLVGASAAAVHEDREAQIREIQATPGVLWVAGADPRFADRAPGASKSMNGVKAGWKEQLQAAIASGEVHEYEMDEALEDQIPDSFDSAEHWPKCAKVIGDIRDQSNCGCCWAFAGAEAASDRMCISTDGEMLLPLSDEDVCFCAESDGCDGGMIDTPWSFIKQRGAVTGGQDQGTGPFGSGLCSSYSLPHCHHHGPQGEDPYPAEGADGCPSESSPNCPSKCDDSAAGDHTDFASDKYSFSGKILSASGEKKIQHMIMTGGPVETAFTVYSDFETYVSGIYHHVTGGQAGGHAVKMVGWGEENGVKYWKIANSWNPYWGEKGYFRITRGGNHCGIEDMVIGSSHKAKWSKKKSDDVEEIVV